MFDKGQYILTTVKYLTTKYNVYSVSQLNEDELKPALDQQTSNTNTSLYAFNDLLDTNLNSIVHNTQDIQISKRSVEVQFKSAIQLKIEDQLDQEDLKLPLDIDLFALNVVFQTTARNPFELIQQLKMKPIQQIVLDVQSIEQKLLEKEVQNECQLLYQAVEKEVGDVNMEEVEKEVIGM